MYNINFFTNNKEITNLSFIFGAPRSGTTWLWSLLEESSSTLPFLNGLSKDKFGNYSTSESGIYVRYPNKAKKVISKFCRRNKNKLIIEKTPSHTLLFEKILKDFPNSKNIAIFRHPLAISNSIYNSNMDAFKGYSLEQTAEIVKKYYHKLKSLIDHDKNITITTYEELSNNAIRSLSFIFKNLNLPTHEINKIISKNHNTSKVTVKGVIRKAKTKSFEEDLSNEEVMYLQQELKNEIFYYQTVLITLDNLLN